MKDKPIGSVICRVSGSCLNQFKLKYQDGPAEDITRLYRNDESEEERQMPANHVIIGFYGTKRDGYRITSLGLILMDTSAYQP